MDDPRILRGWGVSAIIAEVPAEWTFAPSARGGGTRWSIPGRPGDGLRILPGNPVDPNPEKRGPYCRISKHGRLSDPIPLEGNPAL